MHCAQCSQQFEYYPGEKEAYERFNLPSPEVCQECRQRRRMIFRNEKKLYYNKSHKSGKNIITLYPSDSPFKIIDQDEWWDDSFDATEYGRPFDFNKPFFEQFKQLQLDVPRWSRIFLDCENSDYTNNCANLKDSYLAFSCHDSQDLYYCVRVNRSNDCIDCYNLAACQYCTNSINCEGCYNIHYSQLTKNSHDSYFLFDCRSCSDCILCAGVKNGQYMILNEKYSKEDYEKYKEKFLAELAEFGNKLQEAHQELETLKRKVPHKNLQIMKSENCTGDFIVNSKNVQNGYDIFKSEDCVNTFTSDRLKNCYDNFCNDKSELCIECDTNYDCYNSKFCTYFVGCRDVQYLDQCFFVKNSFGCIGLKKGRYIILNKKYTKEEYEKMLTRIIEHMKHTGEYGKPLPANFSAFAYNDTVAYEQYPLEKDEALKEGYIWHTEEAKEEAKKPEDQPEDTKILRCEITGKKYKIIPQELAFYKRHNLPLPKRCPDQRYRDLMSLKRPIRLRDTTCDNCGDKIKTTYKESSPYKIFCEKCYLKYT